MSGGQAGREGRRKRQASLSSTLSAAAILVVGLLMIVSIIIKGRKTKGPCVFHQPSRRMSCRHKALQTLPPLPADIWSLEVGDRGDKTEHQLKTLQPVNLSGLTELRDLRLIKCQLESVEEDTFSQLSQLNSLDLSLNMLQSLSAGTFRGLRELRFVNLSSNPLHRLEPELFTGIKIAHLVLGNNPALTELSAGSFQGAEIGEISINRGDLQTLDAGLFSPLVSSLRVLRITHNQRELAIPRKTLRYLQLERLDLTDCHIRETEFLQYVSTQMLLLDDNPLGEIDLQKWGGLKGTRWLSLRNTGQTLLHRQHLAGLTSLQHLDLSQNQLPVLDTAVFTPLSLLQELHLQQNSITHIQGDMASFPPLKILYLHDNHITHLYESLRKLFEGLEAVSLHGNPLHCNCQLKWLWQSLKDKQINVEQAHTVSCATPQRENLTMISKAHLQCEKPVILNATLDTDRLSIICTAEGDPTPSLSWLTPQGTQTRGPSPSVVRGSHQATSSLPVTRPGNYTCLATNVAGNDTITINTETMPTSGLKLRLHSKEIEILETKEGFILTCVLLCILGYIFRNS